MGCKISQLTEPTIFFQFSEDEDGNPVLVEDFTKYVIRLESESYAVQKDELSPDIEKLIDTNELAITLTQQETMGFEPKEKIEMQIYYEIDGVPNVTDILVTTIEKVLGFEGIV